MSKLRSQRTYVTVGVTLALVLGATGFAMASIPGHGGIIHACYQKNDGSLRVIDRSKAGSTGKCRKSEKPLSWNKNGPPGVQGMPGPQGPPGASVIVRARNSTPLVVPGGTTGNYSLNGGSWTQAATEIDRSLLRSGHRDDARELRLRPCNRDGHARRCRRRLTGSIFRRIRHQHPSLYALIRIRARRAHRSSGQPQRPEWLWRRAKRHGRLCRPGRRRVALATGVGAAVAGGMMRTVGAARTMLVACRAPASAAASAAIITTIIVERVVQGMRERPRSMKCGNHHADERASDHCSCAEHTSFGLVRNFSLALWSWRSRRHPWPMPLR